VAVPIWVSYMGRVLGDSPKEDFPVPDRVVSLLIDEDPSGECLRPVQMAFVKGTETGVACTGVGQPRTQVITPASTPASPPAASQPQAVTPTLTPAAPPNPVPQSQTP
jgi:membrane carboxypeptidase/penicillin-binding protein